MVWFNDLIFFINLATSLKPAKSIYSMADNKVFLAVLQFIPEGMQACHVYSHTKLGKQFCIKLVWWPEGTVMLSQ